MTFTSALETMPLSQAEIAPAPPWLDAGETAPVRTYSASEAAERTGASREGLLTWERRFGFPLPVRNARGHRRYTNRDLAEIARIRASVESGISVAAAIEAVRAERGQGVAAAPGLATPPCREGLDALPSPAAIVEAPDFRSVYANRAFREIFPGAHVGAKVEDVVGFDGLGMGLRRVLKTGEVFEHADHPVVVNREVRCFSITHARLAVVPGRPHHILVVARDKTEEIRAERRLVARWRASAEAQGPRAGTTRSFLDSLRALSKKAARGGLLPALAEHLRRECYADSVTVARVKNKTLIAMADRSTGPAIRWQPVDITASPALTYALRKDRIVWLQQADAASDRERALLCRLLARTLCCAPIVVERRVIGAILIRWSLDEHEVVQDELNFLEVARGLVTLARGDMSSHAGARGRVDTSLSGFAPMGDRKEP